MVPGWWFFFLFPLCLYCVCPVCSQPASAVGLQVHSCSHFYFIRIFIADLLRDLWHPLDLFSGKQRLTVSSLLPFKSNLTLFGKKWQCYRRSGREINPERLWLIFLDYNFLDFRHKIKLSLFSGKIVESNLFSFRSWNLGSQLAVLSPGKDRSRENGKAGSLMESYGNGKQWTR